MVAGAIDSVGLAFGWAVFNLIAVYKHGLAVTGLLNAAMFVGVALSAPVAARLTSRLDGRRVLRVTAATEGLLRVATLALLYVNAPLVLLLVLVLVMNIAAWIGFAAMRVEVAAVEDRTSGMTHYLALTLGLEAVGTSFAGFLPISQHGRLAAGWLLAVVAVYALSLLPTAIVAGGSRVRPRAAQRAGATRQDRVLMLSGALVMAVASGPTLLFVALAAKLHGRESVAGAAIAFAVGSLLAPMLTRRLERAGRAGGASWPIWCLGMVAGWAAAPWSLAGMWLAQLLSGLCLTGFQGSMDHTLAQGRTDGEATTVLAQGSAARAIGSAIAVRLVPAVSVAGALAVYAGVAGVVALVAGVLLGAAVGDGPEEAHPGHLGAGPNARRIPRDVGA